MISFLRELDFLASKGTSEHMDGTAITLTRGMSPSWWLLLVLCQQTFARVR